MELFEYLTEVHNCRGLSSKTQEITAVPSIELGLLPPALSGQPAPMGREEARKRYMCTLQCVFPQLTF